MAEPEQWLHQCGDGTVTGDSFLDVTASHFVLGVCRFRFMRQGIVPTLIDTALKVANGSVKPCRSMA
ncbi:MAG: hypothetical protein GY792_29855 [Gammaproteobacteria bacterium]|nr:hypothetical protein [Gammaproteobacteria bacterium]